MHQNQKNKRAKTSSNIPKMPSDGLDVEYSKELADYDDLKAQARAEAANLRARD